jgi:DNA repair protein RAD16
MVIHSAQSRQHVSHNIRESCDICHEPTTDKLRSKCCGSAFCSSCVADYMVGSDSGETPCPSCNSFFVLDQDQSTACSTKGVSLMNMNNVTAESILRHINLDHFASSTKIEVLVQELVEMRKKRPGNKALVFSQFVTMLDLVRWRMESDPCLESLGLGVQILHGGMSVESRNKAIKEFREESSCRVLLMSLKAAGVALNLTVASECYLLDLWWNPSAEMQAIDRTHRLGQYRPIRAVRIVAQGTVEERILQLQEKKRILFDGTVGRDESSLQRLTQADLAHLFYER